MKKLLLNTVVLFVQQVIFSQQYDWENPAVFKINTEPYHSTLIPFQDLASANSFDRTRSVFYQSLNGTWKFRWVKTPVLVPDNFYKQAYSIKDWDDITVPCNWQLTYKYDRPIFTNIKHPFPANPPYVPK